MLTKQHCIHSNAQAEVRLLSSAFLLVDVDLSINIFGGLQSHHYYGRDFICCIVDVLSPIVTVFGDSAFNQVMKV